MSPNDLNKLGPFPPTRSWKGRVSELDTAHGPTHAIARAVIASLFGTPRDVGVEDFNEVPAEIGLTLASYACKGPGPLHFFGWIGNERRIIPREKELSERDLENARCALLPGRQHYACLVNVSDTGAWEPVHPTRADGVLELLVVFYSVSDVVALYWEEPIT